MEKARAVALIWEARRELAAANEIIYRGVPVVAPPSNPGKPPGGPEERIDTSSPAAIAVRERIEAARDRLRQAVEHLK